MSAVTLVATALLAPSASATTQIDPPMRLPGAGAVAASDPQDWLLGVRRDTPTPAGAKRLTPGTLVVARDRARALAAALKAQGDLLYAEPDVRATRAGGLDVDLGAWARGAVVSPSLQWPAGPAIAVIDDFVDPTHPDLSSNVGFLNATAASTIDGPHGTQVASAAAGLLQGQGVVGVLPGAPIASYGVSFPASCSSIVAGIDAARRANVAIVNLSLGSPEPCYTQYVAVQKAYGVGILVVAASGNDYEKGNPVLFPGAFPHVMSVAAVDRDLASAPFSSANAAVDISAPGVGVPLAIPPAFDTQDEFTDGYTLADGTSFAAPMVAGGAAWIRAARPGLGVGQLADVLRFSARDLAAPGYDDDTGWGLMDVGAALSAPEPAVDPIEPNDGIEFVDGRVFAKPDPPRYDGRGRGALSASTDQWEDPLDVYRYKLAPRSRVRITVQSRAGDADLAVFDKVARTTFKRRGLICDSRKGTGRTDSCTIVWRGNRPRFGYVAVAAAGSESLNAFYTLRFRRLG